MVVLRSLAFNIVMFASGLVLCSSAQLVKRLRPSWVLPLGKLWARITLRALRLCCGIKIDIEGLAHLPQSGAAIIAAQHQSAFDTMVWLVLLPRPAYVLKSELLRLPLFGSLLEPSGFIPVDRNGGAPALRKMVTGCRAAVAQGRQVVIFPEGTRVPPGERGAIQPGIVAVASGLNLPVIPAATDSGLFWGRQAFRKYPGRLKIRIFPPLPRGLPREEMIRRLDDVFYVRGVGT
jgi:1-acyl-sn-glycerol-3-phosphate acyltransferase